MTRWHLHREAWFVLAFFGIAATVLAGALFTPIEALTSLAYLAAIIRGAFIVLLIAMVAFMADRMSYVQRAGLGLAIGSLILSTQSLLIPHTPWDAWASIGSALGLLIYFGSVAGPELWRKIESAFG